MIKKSVIARHDGDKLAGYDIIYTVFGLVVYAVFIDIQVADIFKSAPSR